MYNDTLRNTTEQIIELYHEFLKSEGREGTPLDRLDFWDDQYSRIVDIIAFNTRLGTVRRAIVAALMLFEHYCSNMVEAINGYVPTTRDNVDIVTAFYYDVCDEAAKRVDNVD